MKKIIAFITAVMTLGASVCASAEFYKGGDMTEVSYIESLGGVYKDGNGDPTDPFEFLAANGMNMARIRLSNNPGKGRGDGTWYLPEGFQNEEDCLKLSKRAADAGMDIQFTFNYSDYWSNGTRQIIPSDWVKAIKDAKGYDVKDPAFLKSMTDAQMTEIRAMLGDLVYSYTKDIMTKLKNQGSEPKYVSLGNEINGGMFFPFANTYEANMNKDRFELVFDDNKDDANDIKCPMSWKALADILNRGYDAVKEVSPEAQVVIHIANEGGMTDSVCKWFFDEYKRAGGKFDVVGMSYYPSWTKAPIENCVNVCKSAASRYGVTTLIMETGYNWNPTKKNGYPGQLNDNATGYTEKYPYTQEGQKNFLSDLFKQLEASGSCAGALYWDPAMIHVEDPANPNESLSGWAYREDTDKPDGNVVENTTLFDFDGKAAAAVGAYGNGEIVNPSPKPDTTPEPSGLNVTSFTAENGKASAVVKNNTDKAAEIYLLTAEYNADGKLATVKLDKKTAEAGAEAAAEVEITAEKYTAFLWNGATLEPLSGKIIK